jgi:signal transduction histidine kinase
VPDGPLLSIREARNGPFGPDGRDVRTRGVLGLYDAASRTGYVQDGEAGVFFRAEPGVFVPAVWSTVELDGLVVRRGDSALLKARRFRILPTARPSPEPALRPVSALHGNWVTTEGTWVAMEGVVTGVRERNGGRTHTLEIDGGGTTFTACVAEPKDRPVGREDILGFRVRAQGVVASLFDGARDAGCDLLLPTRVFLRLLKDAPLASPAPPPALRTIDTIRALSPDEAARRQPVRVRGVVTAHDAQRNLLFVQDATAGIYVEAWRHLYDVHPGDQVEVTGWTERGAFAPIVVWPRLEAIGRAPFPPPLRLTTAVLPQADSQWVEIDGVVRSARLGAHRAVLELLAFGERLTVEIPGDVSRERIEALVDAQVRVTGVYKAEFGATRQLVGVSLSVPQLDLIAVRAPAPADPYAAPLRLSDTVLEFHPGEAIGRRLHVRGVVTLHRPGRFFYLRDARGPLRVEASDDAELPAGTTVDVVGFPAVGPYRPVLIDSSYRAGERRAAPAPLTLTPDQPMNGTLDGELVTVEGRLLERLTPEGEARLVLQTPLYVFEAALPGDAGALPDDLPRDSRLRISGVCVVRANGAAAPPSFEILLRGPADVVLVRRAPWWTPRRAALAAATLLAVAAGAFVWVAALRRRVREQTEVLRERLAREAAVEERTRLARELHDSLEQNLAGIGYALEAVKETIDHPQVARAHLDRALTHVDESMAEARRSVRALRPKALEGTDLVAALRRLTGEITRGGVARAQLHVSGDVWTVPPVVEDQLFRIGQEALTNALKHARASRLDVSLRFAPDALVLGVDDDGRGFDTTAPVDDGHYGLAGMRERAARLGGAIAVTSAPGRGTHVAATIPRTPPLSQVS